ncbi:type I polyketide synthase, partial [Streptomyces hilarionis]|uniref:type I polyketide synthase n=1 Tax=Streptomyces hilarionis TaxID=2839954 RepID=UPI002559E645
MGRELWDTLPVFGARMQECDEALSPFVDWSLRDVVFRDGGDPLWSRVDVVQPVLWAVMVSLAAVWRSFGVEPAAVVGHSQGEVAAACVAGGLSLEDGARVVAVRSRLVARKLSGRGGMVSVALPVEQVEERIVRFEGRIGVAAVNGPSSSVVSGEPGALDDLLAECEAAGVRARRIAVDYASHSVQVDALNEDLLTELAVIRPQSSSVAFHSTVTGERLDTAGLDAAYWVSNLRERVLFEPVIRMLAEQDHQVFVESSPHPVVVMAIQETLESVYGAGAAVGSLRRDDGGAERFLTSLAEAYVAGASVDWSVAFAGNGARRVELPTYAFQHEHYWIEDVVPPSADGVTDPVDAAFWGAVERADVEGVAALVDGSVPDVWGPVVPALSAWRKGRQERSVLDAWRYRTVWRSVTVPAAARLSGTWLVVSAGGDAPVEEVREALEAAGAEVSVLPDLSEAALSDASGVVSLLAWDEPSALESTLRLVQAHGESEAPLWVLTRGVAGVSADDAISAVQTSVWALGQVVGLEQPAAWGGLVDVPAVWDERVAASLAGVLAGGDGEDQVAVRSSGVYGRRLVRAPLGANTAPVRQWSPSGTVLVTGGTGGVGGHLARWLAKEGVERLLLVSRRGGQAEGAAELVEELAGLGTEVTVAACDVTDRAALADLLAAIPAEHPLTAVFHTAGVSGYAELAAATPAHYATVLSAKTLGARHLDELTAELGLELDAFVMFSSGAAVWGSAGTGAYAAANAYLDGLAWERRARGLTATSVSWGGWKDTGMATDGTAEQLQRRGIRQMDPGTAVEALRQALEHDETALTVTDMDWARFAPGYTMARRRPLIEDIPEVARVLGESSDQADAATGGDSALRRSLVGLTVSEQHERLLEVVRAEAAVVLTHATTDDITAGKPFRDLGFDSLTAMELRNRLNAATALALPATVVFDYPTPHRLAGHLHEKLFDSGVEAALPQLRATDDDPVVIVGMACRFPGGVRGPEDLWRLLVEGRDEMTDFPADRGWNGLAMNAFIEESGGARQGAFLAEAGDFDAAFFGISPREALSMDPQQRLLLETSWEALERAGYDPHSLRGSRTGVFVGGTPQEYTTVLMNSTEAGGGYALTGASGSVMSGRVAYALGLEGPAVTVDTACSSSLVTLHLAAQALRGGECDLALVGGVTVMATPGAFVEFSRQGGLAGDGRCKAFAAGADGTGWGEGVGMIAVARLSDAVRDGRQVLAVVRGSAVNSDGASNGLTAPNGPSQQRVIRQALASAGLSASDVDMVEAHGTGTALGDPIEAQALLATYGQDRSGAEPLWLGSVKSNIGHTQYAAGVAGVIKSVLAMREGVLPRTLHVDAPTPEVDWSAGAVELLTQAREWPRAEGRPRRAGVSSFGISGTNAHVILEQAPQAEVVPDVGDAVSGRGVAVPWVVSARSAEALREQARRLAGQVRAGGARPVDVGVSLATGRAALEYRAVLVGREQDDLLAQLDELESVRGPAGRAVSEGGTAFLFSGQGSQRVGMGRELYEAYPVFAAAFDEVCGRLDVVSERPVKEVVFGDGEALERTVFAQAGLFALEVALFELVSAWGVRADVLVGHSIGEVAAACVAGVWSLDDACRVVAARGRLMQALPVGGAMVAVEVGEEELPVLPVGVSVAAVNGPRSVVLSGDEGPVLELAEGWAGRGRRVKRLAVSHAFHSARMEPMLAEFRAVLESVEFRAPRVAVVSNVSGRVAGEELCDPEYWVRHVREAVRFADGVGAAHDLGVRRFLELGPNGSLTSLAHDTLADQGRERGLTVAPLLRSDRPEDLAALTAVGRLHAAGAAVDWAAFFAPYGARRVELPTYAFQRRRYWLEQSAPTAESAVDPLRYRIEWTPLPDGPRPSLGGHWAVVVPAAGEHEDLVREVTAALREHGAQPRTVEADAAAPDRAELAGLLRDALGADAGGVVSLLGLDGGASSGAAATAVLLQALTDAGGGGRLWCLTRGSVAVSPSDPLAAPAQAQVWGMGRVAALEQPERWGGLVDLPDALDSAARTRLCAALAGGTGEDQLAVRPAGMFARRLCRVAARPSAAGPADTEHATGAGAHADRATAATRSDVADALRLSAGGTVLVTGGTGALGARLALWLAEAGAEHVLLVGRRGPEAEGVGELTARLRESGAEVTVAACDVADRDALAALIAGLPADRPLTGVVHAAGVLDDGVLDALTPERFAAVAAPKVTGAWNLHELTSDLDLSVFVLFSSLAGSVGLAGQGNYAAANAYLDALAVHRARLGLPATAVAWGSWSGGGMAADSDAARERLARAGLTPLEPAAALAALGRALADGDRAVTVADVDWDRFAAGFGPGRPSPLLTGVPEVRHARRREAERQAAPATRPLGGLGGLVGDELRRELDALVSAEVAVALGLPGADRVPRERTFRALGFDSLIGVEFRNRLAAALGRRLPTGLVFDHPTPARLVEHLAAVLEGARSGSADARPAAPARIQDDPVVIVSAACRFPGGVTTPEEFWRFVLDGRDAVGPFPEDRGWDLDRLYHPEPDHPGTSYVREGGFLTGVADFDAEFFGISPREALAMDPQQRLLLETSWEALERAGIVPSSLAGSRTGVFVGSNGQNYSALLGSAEVEGHVLTGTASSVLSGRIAYTLGLEGPALTVDTACSSSLVALHLAVRALSAGECDLALASGVTVMSGPEIFLEFSRQRGLSADGRCKAFGPDADGTGWGEGVGTVLLERLSDARRLGHEVLGVVRGTAVNQDGASNGLSAPNGPAQQRVIGQALADAGCAPADVDAVEAHGTGTRLGDPIEAQALLAAYGQDRPADRPLWLGSVKSNIGHTQAAAGMAGVLKMLFAMRHGQLPRTLHAPEPTPEVDWSQGAVALLTGNRPWPEAGRPRRAGVSAFGVSGTNAHVILEQAPEPATTQPRALRPSAGGTAASPSALLDSPVPDAPAPDSPAPDSPAPDAPAPASPVLGSPVVPWVLSARSAPALAARAEALRAPLPEAEPADVGRSLVTARTLWQERAVLLAGGPADREASLAALAAGREDARVVRGAADTRGRVVFVFPGQGAQWTGMAAMLWESSPVFARWMDRCADVLAGLTDWSLADVLHEREGAPGLDRVDVLQPASWAVSVSLAALWRSCGVEPAAVVGHSQGEIAAACVAGGLTLEDGAALVVLRSGLIARELSGRGGMMTVALSAADTAERIRPWDGRISVAAHNSPGSTVVAGEPRALDELLAECRRTKVRARLIPVDYASHSAQVERIETRLTERAAGVEPRPSAIPFHSTTVGALFDTTGLDAGYWYRNLRRPVLFGPVTEQLLDRGHDVFLEMSPHPVLVPAVQDTVDAAGATAVAVGSLRRDEGGPERFLRSLAEAFVRGVPVDWPAVLGATGADRPVALPTYPFQRSRFWPEPAAVPAAPGGVEEDARLWRAVDRGDLAAVAAELALPDGQALGELVPALSGWRRRRRDAALLDDWRHRVTWIPATPPAPAAAAGDWLLVAHEPDAAVTRWAATALGATVTTPAGLADLTATRTDWTGVASLLGLADRPHPEHPAVPVGVADTLTLLTALREAAVDAPLWCLTRGAVGTGRSDQVTAPAQAQLWGLGRVAGLETPARWGGLVDLPAAPDERAAALLRAALTAGTDEQEYALRPAGLYVRRLVRAPLDRAAVPRPWRPRPDGTVVVTGGTGALGARVARRLARAGAGHLLLTSRSGPDADGAAELAAELRRSGTEVTIAACDVADREQLAAALALVPDRFPVTAVVHAAGISRTAPLAETDLAGLADVVAAKAAGAHHLDTLLAGHDLDAFVLFSSGAAVWGSAGQGAYAAANAHADALAADRRRRGLVATSVAWGSWAGGGMVDDDLARDLARAGVRSMDPDRALDALQQALDHDESALTVTDMDWERFAAAYTAARPRPLLDAIPQARRTAAADPAQDVPDLAARLARLSPAERDRELLDLVRTAAAAALGHTGPEAVTASKPFKDLGFDSLTAVELRNRLAAATGLGLPATLVFDHPTPAAAAGRLRALLLGDETAAGSPVPAVLAPAADDPVVVVAMACRYPGGATTPEKLWDLVAAGKDGIGDFPADRGWTVAADAAFSRTGGFLPDAAEFDAAFFGISPREALAMDPQQRLLLETSWEALERAGVDALSLRGSRTGVFVGAGSHDYATLLGSLDSGRDYALTGAVGSVLSGRIAYALGLEGPALTVDTACSSSLVALHLAAQALRGGECDLALAGGVAVMATPDAFDAFARQGGLAPDGRCKAFAAGADGTGWGEGVGVLVLTRLSEARLRGHRVLAVLRGSAVNSDGASNGLTAPNGPSQQRVIRQAVANAGLTLADVDLVEAHGTGTTLGDPIEAQALLATYGQDRPAERPLWLGSVKSNIGHTQAAAGVAGVIKSVLAMREGLLPRTLHVDEPTPEVDWSAGAVRVLTEAREWPQDEDRPRRVGVSAFGISGTNAHVILEQAPQAEASHAEAPRAQAPGADAEAVETTDEAVVPVPWVVSARSAQALREQAGRLAGQVRERAVRAVDVGWSLATTRARLEYRAVLVGREPGDFAAGLEDLSAGRPVTEGGTAFLFSGQGSQRVGMGRELYEA